MTATLQEKPRPRRELVAHAQGRGGAALLTAPHVVPAHLLDGGEVVIFAIKPSAWYVVLTSLRWIVLGVFLAALASTQFVPSASKWYLWQLGFWVIGVRMAWATLEWVARLYVLTNRRVMRIRGVFNVEMFECALDRIQNTYLTLSVGERATRTGTVSFQTAGGPGAEASWRMVARPLEVHEKLREAVIRANRRNGNGL
jgi:uncharacterized membrane protein YdbT with pleckstrin-like domain